MNAIEKEIVVEHFEEKLASHIYNSETCCNNGLRKIYGNKAHWLSLLLVLAKKQIAEPIKRRTLSCDIDVIYCPTCERDLVQTIIDRKLVDGVRQTYCNYCGQALDWSEI